MSPYNQKTLIVHQSGFLTGMSYIKVILVINFLSEKNNAVRFQSNFVSLDFLSILIITVQNSSSRVAFNTDSQSMPPEKTHN